MTPEQVKLEEDIAGIVSDHVGVSGWILHCAFVAQHVCVTLDLGAWKNFSISVHLHGAHADIVNAIDVAGYKPSVVVLP